jgi:hypothetical protein
LRKIPRVYRRRKSRLNSQEFLQCCAKIRILFAQVTTNLAFSSFFQRRGDEAIVSDWSWLKTVAFSPRGGVG